MGVTEGKIGILTKRVPLTKEANSSKNQLKTLLPEIEETSVNNIEGSLELHSIESIGCNSNSWREVYHSENYISSKGIRSNTVHRSIKRQKANKSNEQVIDCNNHLPHISQNIKNNAVLNTKNENESINKGHISMKKLSFVNKRSVSENSKYLVHTYSYPNALAAQKAHKVLSESEQTFTNKYSSENIAFTSYSKLLRKPKRSGFLGKKLLCLNRKFSNNVKFRCIITHETLMNAINNSESKGGKSNEASNNIKQNNALIENLLKHPENKNLVNKSYQKNLMKVKDNFNQMTKGLSGIVNVRVVVIE